MNLKLEDLQIVVMDCIKPIWNNLEVKQLYSKILQMKFDGYADVYGDNVISADKVDYYGTHLVVAHKNQFGLDPLFAYKSVTLNRCEHFLDQFPVMGVLKDCSEECLDEYNNLLMDIKSQGRKVSFDYSWAQNIMIKTNKSVEDKILLQDLCMLLVVKHHQDYGISDMITCGGIKVKTDEFFKKLGLNPLSEKSIFNQSSLNGEAAQIFHTTDFSEYAYEVVRKYGHLWENRLTYSGEELIQHEREKIKLVA